VVVHYFEGLDKRLSQKIKLPVHVADDPPKKCCSRYRYSFKKLPAVSFYNEVTVDEIAKDPASNLYIIRLRTATNFYTLEYVYLVENVQWTEQRRLEAAPVKNQ
jgi:hypothetical protein